MTKISHTIELLFKLAKVQSELTRRLDASLNGLSLTEFIILHHLDQDKEKKMRRIDLAEKVGLTASGITRLLLPMEKIGLIRREANEHDARSSLVALGSGGKQKLQDATERAELFCEERFSLTQKEKIQLITLLKKLSI